MADCKQAKKGILKSSSSFEKTEKYRCSSNKEMKWDEMNILQTLHPADKDYGHMKIEEPKTPFSHYKDPEEDAQLGRVEPVSDDETDSLDADLLAKKMNTLPGNALPKALQEEEEEEDEEDFGDETEEERAKRKFFEQKRKLHYNEFYAVKLARKLMEKEGDADEDADDDYKFEEEEDEEMESSKPSENVVTQESSEHSQNIS